MALRREKIEHGAIRGFFCKARSGRHRYMKRSVIKWMRIQLKKKDKDGEFLLKPKPRYNGWEF